MRTDEQQAELVALLKEMNSEMKQAMAEWGASWDELKTMPAPIDPPTSATDSTLASTTIDHNAPEVALLDSPRAPASSVVDLEFPTDDKPGDTAAVNTDTIACANNPHDVVASEAVTVVDFCARPVHVAFDSTTVRADAIVSATGVDTRRLHLPGSNAYWNCNYSICSTPAKCSTPVLACFSTVSHECGRPETIGDLRGIAVTFKALARPARWPPPLPETRWMCVLRSLSCGFGDGDLKPGAIPRSNDVISFGIRVTATHLCLGVLVVLVGYEDTRWNGSVVLPANAPMRKYHHYYLDFVLELDKMLADDDDDRGDSVTCGADQTILSGHELGAEVFGIKLWSRQFWESRYRQHEMVTAKRTRWEPAACIQRGVVLEMMKEAALLLWLFPLWCCSLRKLLLSPWPPPDIWSNKSEFTFGQNAEGPTIQAMALQWIVRRASLQLVSTLFALSEIAMPCLSAPICLEGMLLVDEESMSSEMGPAGGHAHASASDTYVHAHDIGGIPDVANTYYLIEMVQELNVFWVQNHIGSFTESMCKRIDKLHHLTSFDSFSLWFILMQRSKECDCASVNDNMLPLLWFGCSISKRVQILQLDILLLSLLCREATDHVHAFELVAFMDNLYSIWWLLALSEFRWVAVFLQEEVVFRMRSAVVSNQLLNRDDQSALIDESLPFTQCPGDELYSGSICTPGEIEAVIIAIGVHISFGMTAHLVDSTNQVGQFQKALTFIGNFCIFSNGLGAITKRLTAIEEMAGMEVLCSDKSLIESYRGFSNGLECRRRMQRPGESSSAPHPGYLDFGVNESKSCGLLSEKEPGIEIKETTSQWCIKQNIEYIEVCASNNDFDKCQSLFEKLVDGDSQGLGRPFGALSAHMWPGSILKSGSRMTAPSLFEKEVSTNDESNYELEYEVLSHGADGQWEFIGTFLQSGMSLQKKTCTDDESVQVLKYNGDDELFATFKKIQLPWDPGGVLESAWGQAETQGEENVTDLSISCEVGQTSMFLCGVDPNHHKEGRPHKGRSNLPSKASKNR